MASGLKVYEYLIFSSDKEESHTRIRFWMLEANCIGTHNPTKLLTTYEQAMLAAKQGTVKAVADIRDVMADIAVGTVGEMRGDITKAANVAIKTAQVGVGVLGKLKDYAKKKTRKTKVEETSNTNTTEEQ